MKVTVLSGGVGAARFLHGLARVLEPESITAVSNVSDDLTWHGLHVSPDLDTLMYTLADLEGEFGWGLRGDTQITLERLRALGDEDRLGRNGGEVTRW